MQIRVHITGRMYHLTADFPDTFEIEDGATVEDALNKLRNESEEAFPDSCLVALNGEHLGTCGQHANRGLQPNDELTLIAPVAGG